MKRHIINLRTLFCAVVLFTVQSCSGDSEAPEVQSKKRGLRWTPPAPVESRVATQRRTASRTPVHGVANHQVTGLFPSDASFRQVSSMPEVMVPVPGSTSFSEDRALAAALNAYTMGGDPENVGALEAFLVAHPSSRWAPVLRLNLGIISYDTGYFSRALEHWRQGWLAAKAGTDPVSHRIANQALGEYAKMNARVGRMDAVDWAIDEARGRRFDGDARAKMTSAMQGRWKMEHRPEVSFMCGPFALENVAALSTAAVRSNMQDLLRTVRSPVVGFSLQQVWEMSNTVGLNLVRARRQPGSDVIVPSVVHWGVGHFGALVEARGGMYRLKDPTFGNETWMSAAAIDAEASGYFLVPGGQLPAGWSTVTSTQASDVYGRGHSGDAESGDTGQGDHQVGPICGGNGSGGGGGPSSPPPAPPLAMATYRFHTMLASLSITDTPVGYDPPVGPSARVRVTYNQREAYQPATIDFTSFSPNWVSNWVSYIEDNPASPNADIQLHQRGGGTETHSGFDSMTNEFDLEPQSGAIVERLTSNTYRKTYPDGSQEDYTQYIGTTGPERKVFLTHVRDPQGNEIEISYDTTYTTRIDEIISPDGSATTFAYNYSGEPYLVTSVTDPYGRDATFTYTSIDGVVRLTSIEDVIGIVSSFTYSDEGEIDRLTTPYGATTFEHSPFLIDFGNSWGIMRFVEATDPNGDRERVEYVVNGTLTGVPSGFPSGELPDSSLINRFNADHDDRNAFYWSKLQMKEGAKDYSKAHQYHWVQRDSSDVAVSILETEKPPLEGRIWYNYPGQTHAYQQGTLARPSVVARIVDTDTQSNDTQATSYEYNAQGNLTKVTDPLGRETEFVYASNGIDLTEVKQKTGASTTETLQTITYDSSWPHLPATVTDGAGNTTEYAYNSLGQIVTSTNALGEVMTYTYETNSSNNGYNKLLTITGDVPGGNVTMTYDTFDRVKTVTDSEGRALTYDYDDLDRVTKITYPDTSYEQFVYEDHSLTATRDRAGRWTRHHYDALNQRVATRDPLGRVTQFEWCRCGAMSKLIDGAGNPTKWVRDIQGRVSEKIYADNSSYTYTYDEGGRLETIEDAMERLTTYTYKLDDRVAKIDYEDVDTPDVTYTYETWFDRVATRTDGAGVTSYSYHPYDGSTEGAGQQSLVNGPLTDDTLEYTYDELGRLALLEIVDDSTQTSTSWFEGYDYDSRGRIVEVDNNLGTFTSTYAGQSNRVTATDYPNGMRVEYQYFGASGDFLLKQIKNLSSTPSVISQFDYTYNQDRTIDTWEIYQSSTGTTTWTFGYDAAQQLTDAVRRDPSLNVVEEEHYGYDKAANRIWVSTGTVVRTYKVNELNQLVAERGFGKALFSGEIDEPGTVTVNGQAATVVSTGGSAPYRFYLELDLPAGTSTVVVTAEDGSSNSASKTYLVTRTGTTTLYEYDVNGNLRYEREPNETVRRQFAWDQLRRLVELRYGARRTTIAYDGLSRRTQTIEYDGEFEDTNQTAVWCGREICEERDSSSGSNLKKLMRQGAELSTSAFFYVRDHIGSVRSLVAVDGASLQSQYDYQPWGAPLKIGGTGQDSERMFTGHVHHSTSGLYLTWYRAYDPKSGRWLSRDPIGHADMTNLYGYVQSNPVKFVDATGQYTGLYEQAIIAALVVSYQHLFNRETAEGARNDGAVLGADAATQAMVAFDPAIELARPPDGGSPHGALRDALQHCIASCLLTRRTSSPTAFLWGAANEAANSHRTGQENPNLWEDLHNNKCGRDLAPYDHRTCPQACLDSLPPLGPLIVQGN